MDKLLDEAPCCFLTAQDDGEIKLVNKTLLDLLGYDDAKELIGEHVEKILTAGARIFYHTHVFPLLKLQGKAEEIYLDLKTSANEAIPVLLNSKRNSEDEIAALSTYIFIPIRQRSRFEDELIVAKKNAEAANRAKDELLSNVSHELRTPLSAIIGWSQILGIDSSDPEARRKGLEVILNNANAQTHLIDDILDVSRMMSGKLHLEVNEQLDISNLIDSAIDTLTPAMKNKKIEIIKTIRHRPKISADPDRLQQVLWNLMNNAVKFTPSGGTIEVTAEIIDNQFRICVRDSGQGISSDFLPFIFSRLEQYDHSSSRRHGGLGLGLAIAKQIVELHGGAIRAESAGENRGSTFTVDLPV